MWGLEPELSLVANGSINRAYITKPQEELWTPVAQVSLLASDTHSCAGRVTRPEDTGVLFIILPDLSRCASSLGWF